MFESLNVTGHEGHIRWVYLPAVSFGSWTFKGDGRKGTLTAQVVSCDSYRVTQAPLVAVVQMGRAQWRWAVRNLVISGSTLTAHVERQ